MPKILHKSVAWKINNFYMCPTGFRLNSPAFNIGSTEKIKFTLSIIPKFREGDGAKELLKVFFSRAKDYGPTEIIVRYEISLYDVCSDQRGYTLTWRTGDFLESTERSEEIIVESIHSHLILMCKVSPPENTCSNYDDYEYLSKDFRFLLESGMRSDITMVVDDKEFKVHNFILQSRCPKVFAQLVETEQPNVFSLPGVKAEVMKAILLYVYTGKYDNSEMIFESVFSSARNYGLKYVTLYNEITRVVDVIDISTVLYKFYLKTDSFNITKDFFCSVICDPLNIINRIDVSLYEKLHTSDSYLICYKFKKLKKGKTLFMRCSLSIEDSSGNNHFLKECHPLFENEEEWETVAKIESCAIRNLLQNGNPCLLVKMNLSVYGGWSRDTENTIKDFPTYSADKLWGKYRTDLKNLYYDKTYSDFTLFVGDEELDVHKAILNCRLKNLGESAGNCLDIKDFSFSTIKCLISYIYFGDINRPWDFDKAVWLYIASAKFGIPILHSKCRFYIKSHICEEYICDIKVLAVHHDDKILQECVSDFSEKYWLHKKLKILKYNKTYFDVWRVISGNCII